MTLKLEGGRIYDPANGRDGEVGDLYVEDGRIVAAPAGGAPADEVIDISGKVVMAGGIDLHSHIAGGKVNIARTIMRRDHLDSVAQRTVLERSGGGLVTPSTFTAGYRYAELGYTAAFEPAMLPANARQAHMELADTPMLDKGCYVMLGNDDVTLRLLAEGAGQGRINDVVAWTIAATQALGVKVVNPGGISAFKFNGRNLGLDEASPHYGLTPRAILRALTHAVAELGVPHPLHVHCNDLGIPGNFETTLGTIEAADGRPVHLTHLQFHSYGTEGDRKFSSAAAEIAEVVNSRPQVSVDVGQIMFAQTVTASGDTMSQYRNRGHAHPKTWVCMDIECDAGCGLVPFRYRDKAFVNAMQWAIGLELFLLVEDPWRVFLTTDHPNGAAFLSYPHLIRLLMDRSFRNERLATINKAAQKHSRLASLDREYTLNEIAIVTRAGPARILGLADRGHLGPGAAADIAVYDDLEDREAMFSVPAYVFKDGRLVVRDGRLIEVVWGATHSLRPDHDPGIEERLRDHFERYHTVRLGNFRISDAEIEDGGQGRLILQDCAGPVGETDPPGAAES